MKEMGGHVDGHRWSSKVMRSAISFGDIRADSQLTDNVAFITCPAWAMVREIDEIRQTVQSPIRLQVRISETINERDKDCICARAQSSTFVCCSLSLDAHLSFKNFRVVFSDVPALPKCVDGYR